jgi:hypothetical protein
VGKINSLSVVEQPSDKEGTLIRGFSFFFTRDKDALLSFLFFPMARWQSVVTVGVVGTSMVGNRAMGPGRRGRYVDDDRMLLVPF